MSQEHPKRILVIRFGAIGDIVLTFPAIRALKKAWPHSHITYLTKERFAPLIQPQSFIDEVLCLKPEESIGSIRNRVAAGAFDGIIDLHVQLRSRAIRSLSSVPTLGKKTPRSLWESSSVRLGWTRHEPKGKIVEDHHLIIDAIIGQKVPRESLCFEVSDAQRTAAKERLSKAGFDFEQKTLGISPGANWVTKRWPAERFAEIAKRAQAMGYQVLTIGSPAEQSLANEIASEVNVCSVFDAPIQELGALIQFASIYLANDSGPMHIARGLGIPTLAIFGSTSPDQFHFKEDAYIFKEQPCSPCHFYGRKSCPKAHLNCLNDIEPDDVWQALTSLIQ